MIIRIDPSSVEPFQKLKERETCLGWEAPHLLIPKTLTLP